MWKIVPSQFPPMPERKAELAKDGPAVDTTDVVALLLRELGADYPSDGNSSDIEAA